MIIVRLSARVSKEFERVGKSWEELGRVVQSINGPIVLFSEILIYIHVLRIIKVLILIKKKKKIKLIYDGTDSRLI